MYNRVIYAFLILSVCLINTTNGQRPAAMLENTAVLKFTSAIIPLQDYVLDIQLPENYASSNKNYPVVYILDGQWFFPLATGIYGGLQFDGYVPDLILVGIKWGGKDPDYDQLRSRDFKPDNEEPGSPGNGTKFLSVIKNEIIPLIDSAYRTDKANRTLMGASLGGFYTLYAFLKDNTLFNNYLSMCPALGWCNNYLYSTENELFSQNKQLKGKLYLTQGALDGIVEDGTGHFEKFVNQLQLHNYAKLQLSSAIVKDAGHSNVVPLGMPRGLEKLFEKPAVALSHNLLVKYTGTYRNESSEIKVDLKGNNLVARCNNGLERTIIPESDSTFATKAVQWIYTFKMDAKNNCTGIDFKTSHGNMWFAKIR